MAIVTFSSESESATNGIFLPGYHPGTASLLQHGVSVLLKPAKTSRDVADSVQSSTNLTRIVTSRIIFFFPFVLVAQMSLDKVSGSDTFRK